jgi:hypothetical protein
MALTYAHSAYAAIRYPGPRNQMCDSQALANPDRNSLNAVPCYYDSNPPGSEVVTPLNYTASQSQYGAPLASHNQKGYLDVGTRSNSNKLHPPPTGNSFVPRTSHESYPVMGNKRACRVYKQTANITPNPSNNQYNSSPGDTESVKAPVCKDYAPSPSYYAPNPGANEILTNSSNAALQSLYGGPVASQNGCLEVDSTRSNNQRPPPTVISFVPQTSHEFPPPGYKRASRVYNQGLDANPNPPNNHYNPSKLDPFPIAAKLGVLAPVCKEFAGAYHRKLSTESDVTLTSNMPSLVQDFTQLYAKSDAPYPAVDLIHTPPIKTVEGDLGGIGT